MPDPLPVEKLTWAVLLARWVEFARSATAIPADAEGTRLRQSVADIITLQAVWFALGDLHQLAPDEQALGLDRSQVLIERHTAAIRQRWSPQATPQLIQELIDDAHARLAEAQRRA